jgi:hypothetical protein
MGLEIVAISKIIKKTGGKIKIQQKEMDFPDRCHSFVAGEYEPHLKSRVMEVHIGTYGTYNCFKNILCQCVYGITAKQFWDKWEDYDGAPFFEIINSSDNEGLMCYKTCEKLYADFNSHMVVIEDLIDGYDRYDRQWFMEMYDKLTKVFKIAKHEGIIIFN